MAVQEELPPQRGGAQALLDCVTLLLVAVVVACGPSGWSVPGLSSRTELQVLPRTLSKSKVKGNDSVVWQATGKRKNLCDVGGETRRSGWTSTNLSFFLALQQSRQSRNLRAHLTLVSALTEELKQGLTIKLTLHLELTVFPGARRCPRRRNNGPFGEKL